MSELAEQIIEVSVYEYARLLRLVREGHEHKSKTLGFMPCQCGDCVQSKRLDVELKEPTEDSSRS